MMRIIIVMHRDAQPLIPGTSFEQLPGSASLIQTFIRTNPAPNLFSTCSDLGPSGCTDLEHDDAAHHHRDASARGARADDAR